jgi:hypothetical protein
LYRLFAALSTAKGLEDVYIAALAGLLDANRAATNTKPLAPALPLGRVGTCSQAPLVADVQRDDTLAPYRKVLASKRIGSLAFLPLALQSGAFGKFLLYYETLLR